MTLIKRTAQLGITPASNTPHTTEPGWHEAASLATAGKPRPKYTHRRDALAQAGSPLLLSAIQLLADSLNGS